MIKVVAIYNMGRMLMFVAVSVYAYIQLTYKLGKQLQRKIKRLQALIDKDLEEFKSTGRYNKKIKRKCGRLKKRAHKLALFDYLVKKVEEDETHLNWIQESGVVAKHMKKSDSKEFNQLFQLQCIEHFGILEDQTHIESLAQQKSLYIRTSRLKALAAIGAMQALLEGMDRLSQEEPTLDDKLLVECLLHYKGEPIAFHKALVKKLENQNTPLTSVILSYFTLQEEVKVADLVQMYLVKESSASELKKLSILYFEKVIYQPAEKQLIDYLAHEEEELRILSARALKYYTGTESIEALEQALEDSSYKVRENAAKSYYYRINHQSKQVITAKTSVEIEDLLGAVIADETQLKAYRLAEETRKSDEEVDRYRQFLLEQLS